MRRSLFALAFVCISVSSLAADDKAPAEKPVATFAGHKSPVTALAFSTNGQQVLSATTSDVWIWEPATGKEIRTLPLGGRVVAIAPDGSSLATADRENVTIYDAEGKKVASFDPYGEWNRSFAFRPRIAALAFSPDGRKLATASSIAKVGGPHGLPGGVVILWDAKTGTQQRRLTELSTGPSAVAFSADGSVVAAATNGAGGELPEPGEVWVWNVEKGGALQTFKVKPASDYGEFVSAADVALSPDGKQVATAVSSGSRGRPAGLITEDRPSSIRIWDMDSGREAINSPGHKSWVGRVVFSPSGKQLASAGGDRVVRLWNTASGKEIAALPVNAASIDALAYSPDGRWLAAAASERNKVEIHVWDLK